jgi:hypothetical protein
MVQKFNLIVILMILFAVSSNYANAEDLYIKARNDYYKATKNEDALKSSLEAFKKLEKQEQYKAIARTYIGSLIMLKGKYAFWPNQKLDYVEQGLKEMDKGLERDPENIESLFIYGSTCYYLPFFLGKKQLALDKLKELVNVLNEEKVKNTDRKILKNALEFIKENVNLNDSDMNKLNKYLNNL